MSDYYSQFDATEKAFVENTISDCDDEELQKHLLLLSIEPIPNTSVQHRNIIRGITINHILLQRHIDRLNKQNSKTQHWFMLFAVISAIGAVAPYLVQPATPQVQVVATPQLQPAQQSSPIQAKPQVSGQANQKMSVSK